MDETPVFSASTRSRVPHGFHTYFVSEKDLEWYKNKNIIYIFYYNKKIEINKKNQSINKIYFFKKKFF